MTACRSVTIVAILEFIELSQWLFTVIKVENLRRGNSIFSVAPSHEGRAHQVLMRMNIQCHICLQQATVVSDLAQNVVIWSYTTVPVAFRHSRSCAFVRTWRYRNAELPTIGGAGTPFPCVPRQFNHWLFTCSCMLSIHVHERNGEKNTHTHTFNGPLSGTTQVSRYQKGKTNLDFTEARDSEWQWH